jgi:hypothetical protein
MPLCAFQGIQDTPLKTNQTKIPVFKELIFCWGRQIINYNS